MFLARLSEGLIVGAEADGLWFRLHEEADGVDLAEPSRWPPEALSEPRGWQAALQIEHLIQLGWAEKLGRDVRISFDRFSGMLREGFTVPRLWTDWSPFQLSVESLGSLEGRDFTFRYTFHWADEQVEIARTGYYVTRTGHARSYLLDPNTYALLDYVDGRWDARTGLDGLIDFAIVRTYATEVGARLSPYLEDNEVVFPAAVGFGLRFEPGLREVDAPRFEAAFRFAADLPRLWRLRREDGKWQHVVFDDTQLDLLRRVKAGERWGTRSEWSGWPRECGLRSAYFDGVDKAVPVTPAFPDGWLAAHSQGPWHGVGLYDPEISRMTAARFEALIACHYDRLGCRTVLTAAGNNGGVAVVAVLEGEITLMCIHHDDGRVAGPSALMAALAARSTYRRFFAGELRLVLITRGPVTPDLKARTRQLSIELKDGPRMVDELEASGVTRDALEQRVQDRCRSFRDGVERAERFAARTASAGFAVR